MVLEQLDIHIGKNESRHTPNILHKTNLKWTVDLNIKCKTIKPLKDTIEVNLDDLGYGNDFLVIALKEQSMNKIMDKFNCIKIKNSAQ